MYVHMCDLIVVFHPSIRSLIDNTPPSVRNVLCIFIVILLKTHPVVNQNTSGKFIRYVFFV